MSGRKRTVVSVHEAKTNFKSLLERAHGGEEIVIALAGDPWARLIPMERPAERKRAEFRDFVSADEFFDGFPEVELEIRTERS